MLPFGKKNPKTSAGNSGFDYLKDSKKKEGIDGIGSHNAPDILIVPPHKKDLPPRDLPKRVLRIPPREISRVPDFEIGSHAPARSRPVEPPPPTAVLSAPARPTTKTVADPVSDSLVPVRSEVLPLAKKESEFAAAARERSEAGEERLREILPQIVGQKASVVSPVSASHDQNEKPQGAQARMSLVGQLSREKGGIKPAVEIVSPASTPASSPKSMARISSALRPTRRVAFVSAGFLLILFFLIIYFTSSAEITVKPKINLTPFPALTIVADAKSSAMNITSPRIPGLYIETTKTKKLEYAGDTESTVNAKAKGKITVYNNYDTHPQALLSGTRFQAADGKIFRTTAKVTVPGGTMLSGKLAPGTVDVVVVADAAGAEYNASPGNFTIPGFAGSPRAKGFYGKSTTAFSGGSTGKTKTVSSDVIKKAEEDTTAALFNDIKDDLDQKVPEGFVSFAGGRRIAITSLSSPKAGDAGDNFSTEATAKGEMIIVKQEDIYKLLGLLLHLKDDNEEVITEKSTVKFTSAKPDFPGLTTSFSAEGELAAARPIDENDLKDTLSGKNAGEIDTILQGHSEIQSYRLQTSPSWIGFWPFGYRSVTIKKEM